MDDKLLLKFCLLISVLGLIAIWVGVYQSEKSIVPISKLSEENIGKIVKIEGKIIKKYVSKDRHLFLKVRDKTGKIKAVMFKNNHQTSGINIENLKEGSYIEASGKVKKYQGELEIILKKIKLIQNEN